MAKHIYVTGNNDINYTTDIDGAFQLEEVRIHLSSNGGANTLTISLDSGEDSVYDIELDSNDMSSDDDHQYLPTRPLFCRSGDQIKVAWTNASNFTYGVEIIYN